MVVEACVFMGFFVVEGAVVVVNPTGVVMDEVVRFTVVEGVWDVVVG